MSRSAWISAGKVSAAAAAVALLLGVFFQGQAQQRSDMADVRAELRSGFGAVNLRFGEVDDRFAEVNERFAEVNERFAEVNTRFAEVNTRLDRISGDLADLRERVAGIEGSLTPDHSESLKMGAQK